VSALAEWRNFGVAETLFWLSSLVLAILPSKREGSLESVTVLAV